MESLHVYFWLAAFLALGVCLLSVKDGKVKIRVIDALLTLATIYVGIHLYQVIDPAKPAKNATAVMSSNNAELSLSIAQALKSSSQIFLSPKIVDRRHRNVPELPKIGAPQTAEKQIEGFEKEAQRIIGDLVQKNPTAGVLEAKYALITHDLGQPNSLSLERLSHIDSNNARQLHKALSVLYTEPKPSAEEVTEAETIFNTILPKGWYRDTALLELYKKAGRKADFDNLQQSTTEAGLRLVTKLVVGICIMLFSCFVGIIVIIVQLFFLPRHVTSEEDRVLVASPIPFNKRTIYGVFMAWMVTQVLLSSLLQGSLLQSGIKISELMSKSTFVAASLTGALYFLSNAPGLLYIYLIAVKPNKLKFLDTVKFRTKVGKLGPGRMILAGWLSWFAAVPIVIASFLLAIKFLKSEGSSNSIIAFIMEAARSADIPSILMFYFTVGVLAPICEETLFRGFLYTSLRRYWGVFPCMIFSALLFAGVHMDPGGFMPLFSLGCIFAFLVERTKSILPGMVAHGLWNSGQFTMVLLLFSN